MNTLHEDTYRLLAACFYPPTEQLREEQSCDILADLLDQCCPAAAAHANQAAAYLKSSTDEQLLVEYSRLFLGPFKLVAPPYGSVWLDQSKTVMGASTARVAAFYQKYGLQLADDFPELPDHIAVELEFLSYLAFKQREAATAGDSAGAAAYIQAQQDFLTTFLLPWLTPFCAAISDDGEAPFYAAIAQCTASFCAAAVTEDA
ncbi:chaperone TorD involved in molybdoenzyme TorA maturation [Trichlorobacter thiogenes]|uniref:Chaperone TorD involved in molybdoenzyme TorA maturation n=1 Tax=Trichlorobacter thiogenes TaxID=115783 RepID=A0A1T4PP01_9BACT|nr:molecular chaperone TorD family protein [Trichlorobacter thiogenes]SJZ92628.1 chaperone TorD involved in molybdoenzyme TorA maturation [Trichlorobacter thiogenes]